jgi:peptide/nickel transport system permease protein
MHRLSRSTSRAAARTDPPSEAGRSESTPFRRRLSLAKRYFANARSILRSLYKSGRLRYVLRRLITAVLLALVLSLLIFVALERFAPGNEATVLTGVYGYTPARVHAIEQQLGLTRPILVQYLSWLSHALHGNLGTSPISGIHITATIAQEAPVSLELAFLSVVIATVIGIPIGVLAAIRGRSAVALRLPFLIMYATPFYVSGVLLLAYTARYLPFLYGAVYIPLSVSLTGNLQMMILPAVSVGLPAAGVVMQMTRATMLEVLSQPYITTARASGLRPLRLYGLYALKAATVPILSLEGFLFGVLVGGLVAVEDVFSLPGLGRGLLTSISNRDFLQAIAQILVLTVAFIIGNLLVDLICPFVDRRIVDAGARSSG